MKTYKYKNREGSIRIEIDAENEYTAHKILESVIGGDKLDCLYLTFE